MRHLVLPAAFAALLACTATPAAAAEEASAPAVTLEELQRQLAAQQAEIDALKAHTKAEEAGKAAKPEQALEFGTGRSDFGGYGELHYNNLDSGSQIDFHRFVLYFAHEFDDQLRFFSEFELEHSLAGEGKPGEVELEQAYIEYSFGDGSRVTGGLFLMPIGIINETHEPTTFYGVERNPVESNIIPTTWWEAGAAYGGLIGGGGLSYDLAVTSGLKTDGSFNIRNGRQKVASAVAEDLAYTGRLKYVGDGGLEIAASIHQQENITQGLVVGAGGATLYSAHLMLERERFGLRALWASWDLEGAAPAAAEKDVQDGYYVEGSFKPLAKLGVFARYSVWDNGGVGVTSRTQANYGFNWWPHEQVVVKLDVQDQGDTVNNDGLNLGIGYRF
jgi:hypothetical protein